MSFQAVVIPVLKFVGTALAVKSAVEGLKEGNLLQAVLGGVGAYMGLSSMGAFATEGAVAGTSLSQTATNNLAGNAGAAVTRNAVTSGDLIQNSASAGVDAANALSSSGNVITGGTSVTNAVTGGGSAFSSVAGQSPSVMGVGVSAGSPSLDAFDTVMGGTPADDIAIGGAPVTDLSFTAPAGTQAAASPSIFDKLMGFAKDNPSMAYGGMQMAGSMLQGYSQGKMLDEKYAREDEERQRRGTSIEPGKLMQVRFDPITRQLVRVA